MSNLATAGDVDLMFIKCRIEEVAKKHGATMAQVALAWTMAKDGTYTLQLSVCRPVLIAADIAVSAPIIGTTSLEKLEDLLGTY